MAEVNWPRLDDQGDEQWQKVTISYHANKIKFPKTIGPVQSVRSALGTFKLYFDNSVLATIVTGTKHMLLNS
jgi:hypothetical protein